MLTKCEEDKSDPYLALLHYRTSPKEGLPSPSELLMSRQLRTRIPSIKSNLMPKLVDFKKYGKSVETRGERLRKSYNRGSRMLKPFSVGDRVFFKKTPTSYWVSGSVVKKCAEPRSYLIRDSSGSVYRRNREHLKERKGNLENNSDMTIHFSEYPYNSGLGQNEACENENTEDTWANNINEENSSNTENINLTDEENTTDTSSRVSTGTDRDVYVSGSGRTVRPPIRFTFD